MNTLATPQTSTTTWNIDPAHSIAEFKVKHMMIANVKGQFSKVAGALFWDESDLATLALKSPSRQPRFTPVMNSAMRVPALQFQANQRRQGWNRLAMYFQVLEDAE
jgi:hypothetical protein